MIQLFFDSACPAWYPSLRKDLQKRLQVSKINCVRFCLQLDKKTRIGVARFKEINWLNINDRLSQYVLPSIYKFFNSESPEYFNEIYFPAEPSNINTQSSFQRLKQPFRKLNKGLNSVSYSGPLLWNKLPIEIKRSGSTNSFKQCKKLLSNKNGTYRFINIFLIRGDENIYILIVLLQIFVLNYTVSYS